METQRDPVCGMQIDEKNAAGKAQHQGRSYYFCSTQCQQKFEHNPEQYARAGGGKPEPGAAPTR
jgi:Cu+-exporting ATPase